MSFFAEIQNLFKAKSSGVYIGQLIKSIGNSEPSVLTPLSGKESLSEVQINTEFAYKNEHHKNARFFDLHIRIPKSNDALDIEIGIEIKVEDHLLENQLEDYVEWVNNASNTTRKFILLTAHPLTQIDTDRWRTALDKTWDKATIRKIYFSDLCAELQKNAQTKPLTFELLKYFQEMGFAMKKMNNEEIKALKSFLVLTFLEHNAGNGKQAIEKNISNGPSAFGLLLNNWQLVASRFADRIGQKRIPTTRHIPIQYYRDNSVPQTLPSNVIELNTINKRRETRNKKSYGQYWFTSDMVIDSASGLRIEIGKKIQVEKDLTEIAYQIYVAIKIRPNCIAVASTKQRSINEKDKLIFNLEEQLSQLYILLQNAYKDIDSESEVKDQLKNVIQSIS